MKQIAGLPGIAFDDMKAIYFTAKPNPAFKQTQPLPLLPSDFKGGRGRAARPAGESISAFAAMPLAAAKSVVGAICPKSDLGAEMTRLVA